MIVLGIDPGLANTGWGIIEVNLSRYKYIAHGCITTKSSDSNGIRLNQIFNALNEVIEKYKPSACGIETLYFAKNKTSAISVAQARGVVLVLLERHKIRVGELTPNQIKQAVSASGFASKDTVSKMVCFLLGLSKPVEPDHASDALASAIAYNMYSQTFAGGLLSDR